MGIPDVDLDVADRQKVMSLFENAIPASQLNHERDQLVPHNTGIYFQNIPTDPITGLATFPYEIAEELGYYKIDMIPYHIYEDVKTEKQLVKYLAVAEGKDFPWESFLDERFYHEKPEDQVTHLGNHYELVKTYPPQSVMDVAALIALIRPRKRYLIGEPWEVIEEKIWQKLPEEETDDKGSYFFKKSHATAFALVVMVHLQILLARVQ